MIGATDIDRSVGELWEQVVYTCNRVIHQAKLFGFQLMSLPEPNVHDVSKQLDSFVCPLLDMLVRTADFSPESGIRIANIRQYNLHLREIVLALEQDNQEHFDIAVRKLSSEAMLV